MAKRSFESMTKELEDILNELESGQLKLDEMLKLYSRGMELTAKCRIRLDDAKVMVEKTQTAEENPKE